MLSGQVNHEGRRLTAFVVAFALIPTFAIAGVNEDFLEAAKRGDLAAAKSLIARGANVNFKENVGFTASTAASGQPILDKPNGNGGYTALIIASENGDKEFVRFLLAKGAEVNAVEGIFGDTALIKASWSERRSYSCCLPKGPMSMQGRITAVPH